MSNSVHNVQKDLEASNRSKYGEKEFDQISENYRVSLEHGHHWCAENAKRYLNRFTRPGSSKGGNYTDLLKAKDYLERMIEKADKTNQDEVIENFATKHTK